MCYKETKQLPYCEDCTSFRNEVRSLSFTKQGDCKGDLYHVQKSLEEKEITLKEYLSLRSKILKKHKDKNVVKEEEEKSSDKAFRAEKIKEFKKLR